MCPVTTYDKEHKIHIRLYQTEDKVPCPYFVLQGKFAQKIASYFSIQQDLVECSSALKYLIDYPECPLVVKTSLFNSFVMFYGKCYTDNKGRKLKLETNEVFKKADSSLLEIHNQVMDVRNNYLAHAGVTNYERGAMVAVLYPDRAREEVSKTIYASLRCFDHSGRKEDYSTLVNYLLSVIEAKLTALKPKLYKEIDEIGVDRLYNESKLPDVSEWVEMEETSFFDSFVPNYDEDAPSAANIKYM